MAKVKGERVVVKVQRPGLKELFDIDLKNVRVIAQWLQAVDPKSDGAARDWVAIYDECSRILYQVRRMNRPLCAAACVPACRGSLGRHECKAVHLHCVWGGSVVWGRGERVGGVRERERGGERGGKQMCTQVYV